MATRRRWSRAWTVAGLLFVLLFAAAALVLTAIEASIRATPDEQTRRLAGDELVPTPMASITHAITIRADPADVWPWLVQMGADRAGWYSYDWIDNGGRPSASRILPELQQTSVGAVFPALPGVKDTFVVLAFEPGRSLVLGWIPPGEGAPVTAWAIVLEPLGPGRTRLIERGRVRSPYRPLGLPEWLTKRVAPLAHSVMVRKHMRGLAERAERLHSGRAAAG